MFQLIISYYNIHVKIILYMLGLHYRPAGQTGITAKIVKRNTM